MEITLIAELAGLILLIIVLCWTPVAAVHWSLFRSRGNRAPAQERSDGRIEFSPAPVVISILLILEVMAVVQGLRLAVYHHTTALGLLSAGVLLFGGVESAFDLPSTIVIGRTGIEQLYWFRRNKLIRWENVVEINTGDKIKTVTILAADGTKIVHSKLLADRARFLLELKEHCGDNLPADFPREPPL